MHGNITTKELSAIEDQLSMEQVLIKKFNSYSELCTDPALKAKCQQIAGKHQQHFNKLMNYLG